MGIEQLLNAKRLEILRTGDPLPKREPRTHTLRGRKVHHEKALAVQPEPPGDDRLPVLQARDARGLEGLTIPLSGERSESA